jgi:hypothetical protein
MSGISFVGRHWTDAIVAADECDCSGDEGRLGEGDGEVDAPGTDGDVLSEQAGAGVLLDAEEAEEGEQGGTPITSIGEDFEVESGADCTEVPYGETSGWGTEVGVPIPVEEARSDTVEDATSREVGVTCAHGVVGDGGDEARKTGDAMTGGVDDADSTQLDLREGDGGVDAQGGADCVEGALSRLVRKASVEPEGETCEVVDELT